MTVLKKALVAAVALGFLASFAQAPAMAAPDTPPASRSERVKVWTKQRLDAAKKRWAQNKEKFRDCSLKLDEEKKKKRMSLHAQGHFLDTCMREK